MAKWISTKQFEDKSKPYALFVSSKWNDGKGMSISEGIVRTEREYEDGPFAWGFHFIKQFRTEQEASLYYRALYNLSQNGDVLCCPTCGSPKVYTWGKIHFTSPPRIGVNVDCHNGHGSAIYNDYIDQHNIYIWDEEKQDFVTGLVTKGY